MLPDRRLFDLADEVIRHHREHEARLALQGFAPAYYPRRSFACPCVQCSDADICLAAAYELERGFGYVHGVALALARTVVEGEFLRRLRVADDDDQVELELVDDGSVCTVRPRGCSKGARIARRKCQGPGRPRRQLGLLECLA